jgi:hypothetical protein
MSPEQEAEAAAAQAEAEGRDPEVARLDALAARLDRDYPLHGLVTGVQLAVRAEPDPAAAVFGWVRMGARVRLSDEPQASETCASGWYPVYPYGHLCAGEGVEVAEEPPESVVSLEPPDQDEPLPYHYHFVKEYRVPEYHRLPSRDEQRAAKGYASRLGELVEEGNERRVELFRSGQLRGEPTAPAVVSRYLDRSFFVASTGVEVRAFRRFVRTVKGSYVKESRTEQRSGSDFRGVELGSEHTLPLAFALRGFSPMTLKEKDDGSHRMKDVDGAEGVERQSIVPGWVKRERVGDRIYHRLEREGDGGPRYVRSWFIGVAEKLAPPFELESKDEPWVHVDLEEQTLVLYRGEEPVFATLVSSGLDEHATPTGTFRIHKKLISDTMADLGPDAGDDRYRIEDVPWTQYFDGSIALHGAFWHSRFGLQRSHGCVNLSPEDAHRVFQATWPAIPDGWHGVSTDHTPFRGSHVVVTD